MSFRKQQIESVLKRVISELLVRRISDPRIVGMVSITKVDVSPDMSQATIHVSVIPQEHEKTTAAGLNHAASYIHGLLRKEVTFKKVPHLSFRLDHDIKKETEVFAAINRGIAREADVSDTLQEASDGKDTQDQVLGSMDTERDGAEEISGETSGEASGGQESKQ